MSTDKEDKLKDIFEPHIHEINKAIQNELNSLNTIYNQAIENAIEVAKNIYSVMDYEPRMERLISELTKLKKL